MGPDGVSQKLETMMRILADLSNRVQAMEEHQKQKAVSPTASPSTSHLVKRRVLRHQPSPISEPDMAEEVRQMVPKRMSQVPLFTSLTTDKNSTSEEDQPAPH